MLLDTAKLNSYAHYIKPTKKALKPNVYSLPRVIAPTATFAPSILRRSL